MEAEEGAKGEPLENPLESSPEASPTADVAAPAAQLAVPAEEEVASPRAEQWSSVGLGESGVRGGSCWLFQTPDITARSNPRPTALPERENWKEEPPPTRTPLGHPSPRSFLNPPPPPHSTSGGCPPQKANKYAHPEVPTGVLPQP